MADSSSSTTTSTDSTNISSTLSSTQSTYDSTANKPAIFLGSVRTYIAGVLMPTIAVAISCSFSAFPQATITLPADPRLFNVGYRDRVPVQIFVKETVAESPNYILMFEGFVASRSYISMSSQREINLLCLSYLEVLKDTKIEVMSSIYEVLDATAAGTNHINQKVYMPEFAFPMVLFQTGLGIKIGDGEKVKYISCPTEYLANILQFMEEAGTTHASAGRFNDSIVSQYYATLAYNLKMSKRFCWLPYFDFKVETKEDVSSDSSKTGENATTTTDYGSVWEADGVENLDENATMFPVLFGLKTDEAATTLAGIAQQSSKEFSMYDLVNYLLNQVEYEFLAIATPAFQAKGSGDDEGEAIDKGRATKIEKMTGDGPKAEFKSPVDDMPNPEETVKNLQKKYERTRNCDRMVNFCMKPMFDDTFPPKCNIIFRSQVIQLSASAQYNQVPTRIRCRGFNPFGKLVEQQGGSSNALQLFSECDFYPSNYFAVKYDDLTKDGTVADVGDRALISETLEGNEKWTGPWIAHNNVPAWYTYAWGRQPFTAKAIKDDPSLNTLRKNLLKAHEQYMRRQLMRAQILNKTLSASCVFLPYITCGFPAVIYDSAETGFSFAGNVIAYEHQITATGMSTSVTLNGVRLLAEAIAAEKAGAYPNPINAVHAITHNVTALNKVYAAILGTPDASISGAEALDWETVRSTYSGVVTDVTTSPQTNIYEAYKIQRRNIITQNDYCSFMGLTQTPSGTDESGNPPTQLTNDWIQDRADIDVYQIIPLLQQILPVEKLQKDQEKKDESADAIAKEKAEIEEDIAKLHEENEQLKAESDSINQARTEMVEKLEASGVQVTTDNDNKQYVFNYSKSDPVACAAVNEAMSTNTTLNERTNANNAKVAEYKEHSAALRQRKDDLYAKAESMGYTVDKHEKEGNQLFTNVTFTKGDTTIGNSTTSTSASSTSTSSSSSSTSAYTESNAKAATTSSSPTATNVIQVLKEVAEECWANTIY